VAVATAAGRDATLRRDFEGAVEQFTAALDADPQLHVPVCCPCAGFPHHAVGCEHLS
jgi:hypothetical protein